MPLKGSGNVYTERCPVTTGPHEWRQVPTNYADPTSQSQYRCDKCRAIANVTRDAYGAISLEMVSETRPRMIEDRRLTDPYPTITYTDESTFDGRKYSDYRREFEEEARRAAEYSASPSPDAPIGNAEWRRNAAERAPVMRKITSTEALQFILDEITNSPDPFTAAGTWLTRFTNGVAEIIRKEQ